MKRILSILFSILLPIIMSGQAISPCIISSSGNCYEGSNVTMSWTLGEIAVETLSGNNTIMTQGFHQTQLKVTNVQDLDDRIINISVYPNPTSDLLFVEIIDNPEKIIIIELLDATGRLLTNKSIRQFPFSYEIDLKPYSSGLYLLKIRSIDQSIYNIFQIIKLTK